MKKHKSFKIGIISVISAILLATFPSTTLAAENTDRVTESNLNSESNSNNSSLKINNESTDTISFEIPSNYQTYSKENISESKIAPAIASVYFIPGLGQVGLTITGAVILGGITYGVGTTVYNIVKKAIKSGKAKKSSIPDVAKKIPDRLKKSPGYVDLGKFNQKLKRGVRREKRGWRIEPDRNNKKHGGSEWKLYSPTNNDRIATLSKEGKILRK